MRSWQSAAFVGLILWGTALAGTTPTQEVRPVAMWRGQVRDVALEKVGQEKRVIGSQEDFAKLWKAWRGNEETPVVDFGGYRVVVVSSRDLPVRDHFYVVRGREVHWLTGFDPRGKVDGFSYLIGIFPRELVERTQPEK